MVAIDIQKISKWYGSFQVLKNCSTKVDKGEVVVVCGPSGSGKWLYAVLCGTPLPHFADAGLKG